MLRSSKEATTVCPISWRRLTVLTLKSTWPVPEVISVWCPVMSSSPDGMKTALISSAMPM